MTVMKAKITFVIFNPLDTDNPPLAIEKAPPTKSSKILKMDHPLVLLRLQFQQAGGVYFIKVMTSLP